MKILIPIDARLLVNNVEYKGIGTGLFTQLRLASDETTVKSTGTEIETSGVYEFEITGTALTSYLELWICATENGTYTKVKSWGGTEGIRQKNYLTFECLLTQRGEAEPTIEIAQNNTGLVFSATRIDVGNYDLIANRQIFDTHTVLNFSQVCDAGTVNEYPEIRAFINDSESIKIITTKVADDTRGRADDILYSTSFKIEFRYS